MNNFHLFPDQLGFRKPSLHELRGGDAALNANVLTEILANRDRSARRDLITIMRLPRWWLRARCLAWNLGSDWRMRFLIRAKSGKAQEFQRFFSA